MRLTYWPELPTTGDVKRKRKAHKRKTDKDIWHVKANAGKMWQSKHAKPGPCVVRQGDQG